MSKKRMMSKQQRLYYEQNNKQKVQQELVEIAKQIREVQQINVASSPFNPHQISYFE